MAASGFTSSQTKALLESAQAFASLSFLGSLFIIFCWCRYRHLRKLSFTLVLWLAVADIGADITYFMGNPGDPDPNNPTCIAQGSLQQFFQMAQILWTVAIAWALREVTVNLRMYHEGEQKAVMRRFHLFVWGFSLLSMLLPFTTNSYGSAGAWCWIEMYPNNLGTVWRYLVLYVPIWAAIIYNIRVYMRILGVVRRFSSGIDGGTPEGATAGPSSDQQMRMAKFMQRLMWYPAVLIIAWTFATINRIYNTFHPSESIFGLVFMHQMMVNLQGLLNAIVYGSTDAIRSSVFKERCLDCRRGTSNGNDGLDPEDDYNEGTGVGMRDMRSNRFAGNFGAKISGSSQSTSGVSNSLEDVEVYNADDYTVAV